MPTFEGGGILWGNFSCFFWTFAKESISIEFFCWCLIFLRWFFSPKEKSNKTRETLIPRLSPTTLVLRERLTSNSMEQGVENKAPTVAEGSQLPAPVEGWLKKKTFHSKNVFGSQWKKRLVYFFLPNHSQIFQTNWNNPSLFRGGLYHIRCSSKGICRSAWYIQHSFSFGYSL